jgi:hypothetical protein
MHLSYITNEAMPLVMGDIKYLQYNIGLKLIYGTLHNSFLVFA